jgi:hypothetical protein
MALTVNLLFNAFQAAFLICRLGNPVLWVLLFVFLLR